MTPPVDEDEKNEESRQFEAKARKELEDTGCPPCYPPDLDITLRNVPQKFQAIVGYWLALLRTDDVVLCAQASDWRKFRADQLRDRRRFRNKRFGEFVDEVRERRRRHGLGGDFRLLPDPRQQRQLENWIEFQNYHLKQLERLETEQDKSKQKLDDARKLASDTNAPGSKRAAEDVEVLHNLEWGERNLERHKVLLHWIEQQRQAMDPGHRTPPLQKTNDDQAILSKAGPRTSARGGRKRGSKAPAVLGQAKVIKAKSKKRKKRNTLTQKPRQPEFEPTIQGLDAIPQAPMRQETTPRLTKEEVRPLRQSRPQRVSKAKRFANASMESLSGIQRRGMGPPRSQDRARSKRRPAPQRPQPAPEIIKTRSGRISRFPVRWAPE